MSNKFIPVFILLMATVFISGCALNGEDPGNNTGLEKDPIPTKDLPAGFTYMGTHEAEVDIGGSVINAMEGVYRYNVQEDVYIQVIKSDSPETLLTQYKEKFKNANYDPFKEIYINGHKATQVTDYYVQSGVQKPLYTIIWATEKNMFIVGTSEDTQTVMTLASATGH